MWLRQTIVALQVGEKDAADDWRGGRRCGRRWEGEEEKLVCDGMFWKEKRNREEKSGMWQRFGFFRGIFWGHYRCFHPKAKALLPSTCGTHWSYCAGRDAVTRRCLPRVQFLLCDWHAWPTCQHQDILVSSSSVLHEYSYFVLWFIIKTLNMSRFLISCLNELVLLIISWKMFTYLMGSTASSISSLILYLNRKIY